MQNEQKKSLQVTVDLLEAKFKELRTHSEEEESQQIATLNQKNEWLQGLVKQYLGRIQQLETELLVTVTNANNPDRLGRRGLDESGAGGALKALNETIGLKRIEEMELEKLQLAEHIEFLEEKLQQFKAKEKNYSKEVNGNLENLRELQERLKQEEEEKARLNANIKRLVDDLKVANANFVALQKKYSTQEAAYKEVSERVKMLENDKRNYVDKLQKFTQRQQQEDKMKESLRLLENHKTKSSREIEQLRDKYASTSTELQIMKETETTYKKTIESLSGKCKMLQEMKESDERDKQLLISQNNELIRKIEKLEDEIADVQRKQIEMENVNKEKLQSFQETELMGLHETIARLDVEKKELFATNSELAAEMREISRAYTELQNENYLQKTEKTHIENKYLFLVKEYETMKTRLSELETQKSTEDELTETLQKKSQSAQVQGMTSERVKDIILSSEKWKTLTNRLRGEEGSQLSEYEFIESIVELVQTVQQELSKNSIEWEAKYHRLLVKYFKLQDKLKESEKTDGKRSSGDNNPVQLNQTLSQEGIKGKKSLEALSPNRRVRFETSQLNSSIDFGRRVYYNQEAGLRESDLNLLGIDRGQNLNESIHEKQKGFASNPPSNLKRSNLMSTPGDLNRSQKSYSSVNGDYSRGKRYDASPATVNLANQLNETTPNVLPPKENFDNTRVFQRAFARRASAAGTSSGTNEVNDQRKTIKSRADTSFERMNRSFEAGSMELLGKGKKSYFDMYLKKNSQNNSVNQSFQGIGGMNDFLI